MFFRSHSFKSITQAPKRASVPSLGWKPTQRKQGDAFQSERKTELCVCCRADTSVCIDTPVDARRFYQHGVGQLCERCAGLHTS